MELIELESILKIYDKKVAENTRLNREVLKKILTHTTEKHFNKEKLRAAYYVLSPVLLVIIIKLMDIRFNFTTNFYVGVSLFVTFYLLLYVFFVTYYILLCKVDFTDTVLSIKKKIVIIEKYKIKVNRMRNILMPIIICGAILIFTSKITLNLEFVIFIVLIAIVFVGSAFYTKHSVEERYKALNNEIEILEKLEQ